MSIEFNDVRYNQIRGVVELHLNKPSLDEKELLILLKKIEQRVAGKKVTLIILMNNLKSITRPARQLLCSVPKQMFESCVLLPSNHTQKIISRFFWGLNKTDYPVAVLKSVGEAYQWVNKGV